MARPKQHKRVITGGSITLGWGGLSLDTTLVTSDAHHCQVLVDVIDDKDVFVVDPNSEDWDEVIHSLNEVRKLAVSTKSLVRSEEVSEEASHIASACRQYMRESKGAEDPRVLSGLILSMRAQVGESVAFLVKLLKLSPPTRFDYGTYEQSALDLLEGWLNQPV